MLGFKKGKLNKNKSADVRLAKKLLGKDSGRRVFGFSCSPDIQAKIKMLAGQLNIPIFALAEHALEISNGLIAKMVESDEESTQLRKHLIESHVDTRTVEKIAAYDQEMADRLDEEMQRRFEMDKAVRQIVVHFIRSGIKPKELPRLIDYGMRCRMAIARGYPMPKY